ncbi:MAG: ComEC family competence protein [Deltaproteobacteria bacterium]|nr:ComEC family competence protein [Deltaproteobacteria bacterium]
MSPNPDPTAPEHRTTSRVWARPSAPATLALMAGIAASAWGVRLPEAWLKPLLAGAVVLLGLSWWLRLQGRALPLAFLGLVGMALGQQALAPAFPPHHLAHLPVDQEVRLLGRVDKPAKLGPERLQLVVAAEARHGPQGWRPATGRLLLYAPKTEPPPVGARLVLKGKLREVEGLKNPGAFNLARHWAAEGIFRQMSVRQEGDLIILAGTERQPLGERLRRGIRELLKNQDEVTRSLYLAMLLGDQGEITQAQRQAFSRTGTSHLVVISGLHLSMVAAAVYFLVSWLLRRSAWLLLRVNIFKISALPAAAAVAAYAWVAGGSPATQRAEIMVLSYLLLVFLGRAREIWSALALAALVILALSPLRLFAISFQLSFVAVAAIIMLASRWGVGGSEVDGWGGRSPRWAWRTWLRVKGGLKVSAAASLGTAPLVAFHFQVVSLLGWLVNLAAIPLMLALALPLGEIAVLCQALHLPALGEPFLWLGSWPLRLGYRAIEWAAAVPGAALLVPTPTWLQVALCYVLLLSLFWAERPRRRWGGAALAAALLAATVVLPRLEQPAHLEITCLDSRSGLDGVAVTPEGRRLVFSAAWEGWPGAGGGGGFGALPSYLHWRQFRQVDAVLALGLNRRNAAELLSLAQQFAIRGFWFRDAGELAPEAVELRNLLGDRGAPARSLEKGGPPSALGSVTLTYPSLGEGRGVGLLLTWEGRRVLIVPPRSMDDAAPRLPPGGPPAVLVAPGDLAAELAPRLRPQVLVIYGEKWVPPASALPVGLRALNTAQGAVTLAVTPGAVTVQQWRRP